MQIERTAVPFVTDTTERSITVDEDRRDDRPAVAPGPERRLSPVEEASSPRRRTRSVRSVLGFKSVLILADLLAGAIAMGVAAGLLTVVDGGPPALLVTAVSLAIWPVLFAQQGLYQSRFLSRRIEEARRLTNGVVLGLIATAGVSVLLQRPLDRTWLTLFGASAFVALAGEREIMRRVVAHMRATGRLTRRVVVVGDNGEAAELIEMLRGVRELGYEVVGRISDSPPRHGPRGAGHTPYLGSTEDALEVVRSSGASSVIIATTGISLDTANRLVRELTREGIYVELSSAMRDIATRRVVLRPLGRYPVMSVEPVSQTGWRPAFKRAFDLVAASIGTVLVLPILTVAAVAIRVTSGPGVLFRQVRVGRDGTPFTVYKLRTMVHGAENMLADLMDRNEASGPMFKMADDPRVTPVGRFLRKTSIDELPQLFNVVLGQMSLVGPRPALPHEAVQWNDDLKERLRVKPGITGNWQVSGRFTTSMEDYQRLDLYYVDNWSLISDLIILIKTVPAVLKRNGAA